MSTSDVVVIGGGIAGIGCAAMIAERMAVTVVERESALGYHSTSRSAAVWIPSYGPPPVRALSAASEGYLAIPPADLGVDTFLHPRGQLLLADADEAPEFDAMLADAPELVEIGVDDAIARVPILARARIARACVEDRTADIDVDRLLQCWARLLRGRGGRVLTDAPVTSIERRGTGWRVAAGSHAIDAALVVDAAGAWADEVAALAGLERIGLVPRRRSMAVLPAPAGHAIDGWPLFGSLRDRWYAKPAGGKLIVSPADTDAVEPHDAYVDDLTLAEGLHRYEQAVEVPVTRVEHRWAGLRTFAPDELPVVGRDPRAEGFLWCAGQGGYGVQTAPAVSRIAAAIACGDEPAHAPEVVAALDPARLTR